MICNKMVQNNGPIWVLTLNEYQRNNLLMLLNLVGWAAPENVVPPFDVMNNGDWVGEIQIMLGKTTYDGPARDADNNVTGWKTEESSTITKNDGTNMSIDEVRRRVAEWAKREAEIQRV